MLLSTRVNAVDRVLKPTTVNIPGLNVILVLIIMRMTIFIGCKLQSVKL